MKKVFILFDYSYTIDPDYSKAIKHFQENDNLDQVRGLSKEFGGGCIVLCTVKGKQILEEEYIETVH